MIGFFSKVLIFQMLTKSWRARYHHKVKYLRGMVFKQIDFLLESKDSVIVVKVFVLVRGVSPLLRLVGSVGTVVISLKADGRHPDVRLPIARDPELLE